MKNFINLGIFIPLRASLLEFINSMDVACADAALQSLPGSAFCSLPWAKTEKGLPTASIKPVVTKQIHRDISYTTMRYSDTLSYCPGLTVQSG